MAPLGTHRAPCLSRRRDNLMPRSRLIPLTVKHFMHRGCRADTISWWRGRRRSHRQHLGTACKRHANHSDENRAIHRDNSILGDSTRSGVRLPWAGRPRPVVRSRSARESAGPANPKQRGAGSRGIALLDVPSRGIAPARYPDRPWATRALGLLPRSARVCRPRRSDCHPRSGERGYGVLPIPSGRCTKYSSP